MSTNISLHNIEWIEGRRPPLSIHVVDVNYEIKSYLLNISLEINNLVNFQ